MRIHIIAYVYFLNTGNRFPFHQTRRNMWPGVGEFRCRYVLYPLLVFEIYRHILFVFIRFFNRRIWTGGHIRANSSSSAHKHVWCTVVTAYLSQKDSTVSFFFLWRGKLGTSWLSAYGSRVAFHKPLGCVRISAVLRCE